MLEKNAKCTARFMPPWGGLFPGSGEDAGIVKPSTFHHLVGTLLPSFIIVPLLALIYKRRVTDKRLPLHPAKDLPAEFSLKDAPYDFHYGFWSCLGDLRTCCCVCCCPAIKLADYISQTAPFYALGFLDGGGPLSHGCGFWTVVFFCLGANAAIYIADFFTPGEESYSNIYRCIVYFCTMAKWRHKVRQRLGAPKTWSVSRPWHKALLDHLAWYFCWPCAMTQEARELDRAQGVTFKCCCIHQDSPAGYTRMPKVGDPVTIEQPQGLELVFRDQDGAERKFLFTEVPLGLGYRTGTSDRRLTDDKQPVTVTKIVDGSIAQKLGVKLGMRLLEVDGEKVEFESRSLVDYKIKLAKERRLNKENERIERVEQQLMTQGSPNRNESQRTLYT
jgi:Cys-rich protein (TIGR01571 family)